MKYCLTKDIYIEIGKNEFLFIRGGFIWNGDSFVSDICSFISCFHDWCYSNHRQPFLVIKDGIDTYVDISRLDADKLYKKFLKRHYPAISRIRFFGLRLLGWIFYQNNNPYFLNTDMLKEQKIYTCKHGSQVKLEDGSFELFAYYKI